MRFALDLFLILAAGLLVGNEFAIAAFVHPAIRTLPLRAHAAAAARIASVLGRVMPFWYALVLLLNLAALYLDRAQPHRFRLLACAAALWAATILVTVILLVPRNNRIARVDPDHPYTGWETDRTQWDALHRVRVLLVLASFVLQLLAILPPA